MSTDAVPTFFPADLAFEAMGNTSKRWQNHYDTKKIFAPPEVTIAVSAGPGRGKFRQIALEAIVQGRIAFALMDGGASVVEAYRIAAQFSYLGENKGPRSWDEAAPLDPVLDRCAGCVFAVGDTFLIWRAGGSQPDNRGIAILSDADPVFSCESGISAPLVVAGVVCAHAAAPRVLINLSQICREIAEKLGLDFDKTFVTEVE